MGDRVVLILHPGSTVDQITLRGLEHTRPGIILREFEVLQGLKSIEDIHRSLELIHGNLMSLGVFEAVDILLDESAKDGDRISVSVTAAEGPMVGVNAGTYVQGSEGTVEATLNLRNYAGFAEKVAVSIEHGISRSNIYSVALSVPRIMTTPYGVDVKVQQLFNDREKWSSFVERLRGVVVTLSSDDGRGSLSYDCGWRRLSDPTRNASSAIASCLGDSMKSSLTYSFAMSAFDSVPKIDGGIFASFELGGLGTDRHLFQFVKLMLSGRMGYELNEFSELFLEGNAGVLVPSSNVSARKINPCDRFYLGGLGSQGLRGFHQYGVGHMEPRRRKVKGERAFDSLGGTAIASLMAALRFDLPIPTLKSLGLQGQLFCNAGAVGDLQQDGQLSTRISMSDIKNTIRVSLGAGLVWPLTIGQLELNYCHIVAKGARDYCKNGVQFGISPY